MSANRVKLKPDWAGDDFLSRLVNLLIQTKPIYNLMKRQARQVLIKTAEKNGITWRQNFQELAQSGVKELYPTIENPQVEYPDYYQVPFHAYDQGNLCWEAAFEAESATQSMGLRVWKDENDLTWQQAQERLRGSFHEVLAKYLNFEVKDVLDIGCSVGISTITLRDFLLSKQTEKSNPEQLNTVGLDLSPYMLAVAQQKDTQGDINWIHGKAEETGFADNSLDLVTMQFVIHELPHYATEAIFREIKRILRPGGMIAIVDNNPGSAVIQKLPPVLFTLMKSTEPWSDDYYTFDVEVALKNLGFDYQITVESDPRHRAIIAYA